MKAFHFGVQSDTTHSHPVPPVCGQDMHQLPRAPFSTEVTLMGMGR